MLNVNETISEILFNHIICDFKMLNIKCSFLKSDNVNSCLFTVFNVGCLMEMVVAVNFFSCMLVLGN